MGAVADDPRGHPDDESKKRWFFQDFSATTMANANMELRTAADCIQRMKCASRERHGPALDRFLHQCGEPEASAHFEAPFRNAVRCPFMYPALRQFLQELSGDETERPHGGFICDHMEDSSANEAEHLAESAQDWQLELASSEDSERTSDRMHRVESGDPEEQESSTSRHFCHA